MDTCTLDHPSPPASSPALQFADLPTERLESVICQGAANLTAAEHQWLLAVAEFERRGAWKDWGLPSCAHWLSWHVGLDIRAAREKVRVATALTKFSSISTEMSLGHLSYTKVRAITRVVTPESEPDWVQLGLAGTTAQIEHLVTTYRRWSQPAPAPSGSSGSDQPKADDGGPAEVGDPQWRARSLTARANDDRTVSISLRLPASEALEFLGSLEPFLPDADPHDPAADPIAARRADAAVDAVRSAAAGSSKKTRRPLTTIRVDLDVLASYIAVPVDDRSPSTASEGSAATRESGADPTATRAEATRAEATRGAATAPASTGGVAMGGVAMGGAAVTGSNATGQHLAVGHVHPTDGPSVVGHPANRREGGVPLPGKPEQPSDGGASGVGDHIHHPDGCCEMESVSGALDGPVGLAMETVMRVLCDCDVENLLERDGRVQGVSSKKGLVTGRLRRLVMERDHHRCRFPGCRRRVALDVHHLQHRTRGGSNALNNLMVLCRFHHHQLHEGGWKVVRSRTGIEFHGPTGVVLTDVPAVRSGTAGPVHAQGRSPEDGRSQWQGDRLDLGFAIDLIQWAERPRDRWPERWDDDPYHAVHVPGSPPEAPV